MNNFFPALSQPAAVAGPSTNNSPAIFWHPRAPESTVRSRACGLPWQGGRRGRSGSSPRAMEAFAGFGAGPIYREIIATPLFKNLTDGQLTVTERKPVPPPYGFCSVLRRIANLRIDRLLAHHRIGSGRVLRQALFSDRSTTILSSGLLNRSFFSLRRRR